MQVVVFKFTVYAVPGLLPETYQTSISSVRSLVMSSFSDVRYTASFIVVMLVLTMYPLGQHTFAIVDSFAILVGEEAGRATPEGDLAQLQHYSCSGSNSGLREPRTLRLIKPQLQTAGF